MRQANGLEPGPARSEAVGRDGNASPAFRRRLRKPHISGQPGLSSAGTPTDPFSVFVRASEFVYRDAHLFSATVQNPVGVGNQRGGRIRCGVHAALSCDLVDEGVELVVRAF